MPALVYAIVTKAPCAFVADVAFPVAAVGEGFADIAEDAVFETVCRVVFGTKDGSCWAGGLLQGGIRSSITVACEDVWMFVVRRIPSGWCLFLVSRPRCPSEPVPMLAAFS